MPMQDQLYYILKKLIVKNNIAINSDELKLQISSHPSYPSLHALTGVLDHFGILNVAMRVDASEAILSKMPSSFIAQVATDNGDDLVLVEKKKAHFNIVFNSKKNKTLTEVEFLNQWNGIIVAIEKDENVQETGQNHFTTAAKWYLVLSSAIFICYLAYSISSLFVVAHLLLSIIGLVLSVIIVTHELGMPSSVTNSFCNFSEKTSCDAVLNSKGALIFGQIKLSDLSIVTFMGYCLCWVLTFVSGNFNFSILPMVSLLAFPFILYSVYYQYAVVKKWCPLCLAIASVLLIQFAIVILNDFSASIAFDWNATLLFAISLFSCSSIWSILKPILIKKESLAKLEIEHYKFKKNFILFNALFSESKSLQSFHQIPEEIVFGNPKASIELVIVTSPFCYYCKQAHHDIEKILKQGRNEIKVTIRFNVSIENKDNDLYKIASRLIEIYNIEGETACLKAMAAAYQKDANLKEWLQNHESNTNNSYDPVLKSQESWCRDNAINFTPALYINQKNFPNEYDRTDLIYFIDDLIEQQQIMALNTQNLVVQQ